MNWIECSPEEATRATVNGKVLKMFDGCNWRTSPVGMVNFTSRQLEVLGAIFEKEAPQEWVVEFNEDGDCTYPDPLIGDVLRGVSTGRKDSFDAVKNATFLIKRLK